MIRRMHEYFKKSDIAVYDWMRFLTKQKLAEVDPPSYRRTSAWRATRTPSEKNQLQTIPRSS